MQPHDCARWPEGLGFWFPSRTPNSGGERNKIWEVCGPSSDIKKMGGIFLSHWGKYNYFEENRLHERKHLQRQHHTPLAFMTSMASKTCQSPSFYKAYHPVLRCTVVLAKEVHRDIGQKKAVKLGSHYDTKQHETHFILFFAFQYN